MIIKWSNSLNSTLKCLNYCSIHNIFLHGRLSTFPYADVMVLGISQFLNSWSMCLHTHTHTIKMAGMCCMLSLEVPNGSCINCCAVFSASNDKVNTITIAKWLAYTFHLTPFVVLLGKLNAKFQEIQRKHHSFMSLYTICWLSVNAAGFLKGALFRGTEGSCIVQDKDRVLCYACIHRCLKVPSIVKSFLFKPKLSKAPFSASVSVQLVSILKRVVYLQGQTLT